MRLDVSRLRAWIRLVGRRGHRPARARASAPAPTTSEKLAAARKFSRATHRLRRIVPLILGPVVAVALARGPAHSDDSAIAIGQFSETSERTNMRKRLELLVRLESALLAGDRVAARSHGGTLADTFRAAQPPWGPSSLRLTALAVAAATSESPCRTVTLVAQIVGECADCHRRRGISGAIPGAALPTVQADSSAGLSTSLEDKMLAYRGGVGLLRTSLLFSEDDLWNRGLHRLSSMPLHAREMAGPGPIDLRIVEATELFDLSVERALADNGDGRLATYRDLLTTCVGCHQRAWTSPETPHPDGC